MIQKYIQTINEVIEKVLVMTIVPILIPFCSYVWRKWYNRKLQFEEETEKLYFYLKTFGKDRVFNLFIYPGRNYYGIAITEYQLGSDVTIDIISDKFDKTKLAKYIDYLKKNGKLQFVTFDNFKLNL